MTRARGACRKRFQLLEEAKFGRAPSGRARTLVVSRPICTWGVRLGAKDQDPRVRPFKARVHVTDHKTMAVTHVKERDSPRFPGAPPGRRQQQDGSTASQRQPAAGSAVQLSLER